MRRHAALVLSLLVPLALLAAACGDEDDGGAIVAGDEGGDGAASGGSSGNAGSDGPPITIEPLPAGDPNAPVVGDPNTTIAGDGGGTDGSAGGANVLSPEPGMVDPHPAALDSAIRRDGDKIEARFYGGVSACYGVDHVDVEETDTEVRITVFTGSRPEAAAMSCIDIAELQAVIVALDAPLGERRVIDGSSGAEVPLS